MFFRRVSGIFFMASETFPMDPNKSPKFGVAARGRKLRSAGGLAPRREGSPQKADQAPPAAHRAKVRARTLAIEIGNIWK